MNSEASCSPTVEVYASISEIVRSDWQALTNEVNPFFEYDFLAAAEDSGIVGEGTGWIPRYLVVREGHRVLGATPLFLKYDSYGEFIFDWSWAEAYRRAGLPYYPKALVAAPFTPVTGERLLVHPQADYGAVAAALIDGLFAFARSQELSGLHVLFPTQAEHGLFVERGMMSRVTHQFHWENEGYETFADFAGALRSKKRKQVLRERAQVADLGVDVQVLVGDEIREEHLDAMWRFYADTISRKWSQAYLNADFFRLLGERCRSRLVLVMVRDGERWIAGTLNFRKGGHLYGRYWGAAVDSPSLHFECCFYRLIEYAIDEGLALFEAGAQGEHKFLRGFVARPTYSAHWLAHPGGARAVEEFLEHERDQTRNVIAHYNRNSPLKSERARHIDEGSQSR